MTPDIVNRMAQDMLKFMQDENRMPSRNDLLNEGWRPAEIEEHALKAGLEAIKIRRTQMQAQSAPILH